MLVPLIASGCASSSDDIGTSYVSPTLYKAYTCDELLEESTFINQRVAVLVESIDNASNLDTAQTTGAFVLAPFTLGLSLGILGALEGGDGPEAIEYAQLKGQHEAVRQAAIKAKCKL